jgi:hypothetical protein
MPNNLDSFGERLSQIKEHFRYNNVDLGKLCDVSHTAIHNLIAGTTKTPKIDLVSNLEQKLSINLKWLMYGEGKMFKEGANASTTNYSVSGKKNNIVNASNQEVSVQNQGSTGGSDSAKDVIIKFLKSESESLKRENEHLYSQLERANKTIDMLEGLLKNKQS